MQAEGVEIPQSRVLSLLDDVMAILNREDLRGEDHSGMHYEIADLLCLMNKKDPAAATERMNSLRSHRQAAARKASQRARERLSPNWIKIAVNACNAGLDSAGLPDPIRVINFVFMLDVEVANGGWLQWVANSTGARATETLAALGDIGASVAVNELRKVMDTLGPEGYSADQERRKAAIDRMISAGHSIPESAVMWNYSTELRALLYDYAERNPAAFSKLGASPGSATD
jgi:hypothetical protein